MCAAQNISLFYRLLVCALGPLGHLLAYCHPLGIAHSLRVAAIPESNSVATFRLQPVTVRVACRHSQWTLRCQPNCERCPDQ